MPRPPRSKPAVPGDHDTGGDFGSLRTKDVAGTPLAVPPAVDAPVLIDLDAVENAISVAHTGAEAGGAGYPGLAIGRGVATEPPGDVGEIAPSLAFTNDDAFRQWTHAEVTSFAVETIHSEAAPAVTYTFPDTDSKPLSEVFAEKDARVAELEDKARRDAALINAMLDDFAGIRRMLAPIVGVAEDKMTAIELAENINPATIYRAVQSGRIRVAEWTGNLLRDIRGAEIGHISPEAPPPGMPPSKWIPTIVSGTRQHAGPVGTREAAVEWVEGVAKSQGYSL